MARPGRGRKPPASAGAETDGATGRERILASALKLFEERGYRATSVQTIASHAEVAKGSVYWHFACKEDLLVAIVDLEIERVKSRLDRMFGRKKYDPARVVSVASDLGFWVKKGVERIRRVVMGALLDAGGGPKARRLDQKLVTRTRAVYMEARDALSRAFEEVGTPAGLDPKTASTCLMACVGGLLHFVHVIDSSDAMSAELTRGVQEIFLGRAGSTRRSRSGKTRKRNTGGRSR